MWSPMDAACQPAKATRHFVGRATRAGVHIAYGVKVIQLLMAVGRIAGVHTTAGPVAANAVVLAGGVWTPYLANTVGVKVPLMPVVMSELKPSPSHRASPKRFARSGSAPANDPMVAPWSVRGSTPKSAMRFRLLI